MRVLIIRVVLGLVFAFFLLRFFYPASGIWTVVVTAALLVFFAYFFEAIRKGRSD